MFGFRHILHPVLEFLLLDGVDIGTAHIWFVLMIGLGRFICWPVGLMLPRAPHTPLVVAFALLAWRLLVAPAHIGLHSTPVLRGWVFYFFFGDKNFHQARTLCFSALSQPRSSLRSCGY